MNSNQFFYIWMAGWLFTIGFSRDREQPLGVWLALFSCAIWPGILGYEVADLIKNRR